VLLSGENDEDEDGCRFIGQLLKLLVCNNEKFGTQIQKHVKELVGHELNSHIYPILFDRCKAFFDKFFDASGQVRWFTSGENFKLSTWCVIITGPSNFQRQKFSQYAVYLHKNVQAKPRDNAA